MAPHYSTGEVGSYGSRYGLFVVLDIGGLGSILGPIVGLWVGVLYVLTRQKRKIYLSLFHFSPIRIIFTK